MTSCSLFVSFFGLQDKSPICVVILLPFGHPFPSFVSRVGLLTLCYPQLFSQFVIIGKKVLLVGIFLFILFIFLQPTTFLKFYFSLVISLVIRIFWLFNQCFPQRKVFIINSICIFFLYFYSFCPFNKISLGLFLSENFLSFFFLTILLQLFFAVFSFFSLVCSFSFALEWGVIYFLFVGSFVTFYFSLFGASLRRSLVVIGSGCEPPLGLTRLAPATGPSVFKRSFIFKTVLGTIVRTFCSRL
jgi:hypothetical protein